MFAGFNLKCCVCVFVPRSMINEGCKTERVGGGKLLVIVSINTLQGVDKNFYWPKFREDHTLHVI